MSFRTIAPREIPDNAFKLIGDDWMLVTAGDKAAYNTMTASWGGIGVLWNKDVATCYVRPQRYTFGFMEKSEYFTLSFFGEEFRPQLRLCGAKSGRDVDKVSECGFTTLFSEEGAPYFAEARLVLICRTLYFDDIKPEKFLDPGIEKNYPAKDYHRMYIAEIVRALTKD